jgi:hypothetical protein
MIKHLLIAITLLAGCDGYHWFYACDDPNKPPNTTYCTTDSDGGGPCEAPGVLYYVWLLGEDCREIPESFCAVDDEDAQAKVDDLYGDATHSTPSTNQGANEPTKITVCGSNPDDPSMCVLGSSDESMGTTFWYFTPEDLAGCEMALDSGCTKWDPVDPQTGNCPGSM